MASLRDFKLPSDEPQIIVVAPAEPAAEAPVVEVAVVEVDEPALEGEDPAAAADVEDPLTAAGDFRVTPEELAAMPEPARKQAKALQADYTRKTQALAEERRALSEREKKRSIAPGPMAGGDDAGRTLAHAVSATGHAPLRVLLGESEDWEAHLPMPERLAIDDLSDDDLYDPAKLRAAVSKSIEEGTRARTSAAVRALIDPYRQEQARVAQDVRISEFVQKHPGMEVPATRKAIYVVADRLGLKGADGLSSAYRVWVAEGGKPGTKAALPARAASVPATSPGTAQPSLETQVAVLTRKLARAPADAARALAAEHVGKSGLAAGDQEPVMPADLSPEARQRWIAAHPKAAADMRRQGLKGLRAL